MVHYLKYAGHLYRLAQDEEAPEKSEETKSAADLQQERVQAVEQFLANYNIKDVEFYKYFEGEAGYRVAFRTLTWQNANAIIVFDFVGGKKPKLQTMSVVLCDIGLAASGAVEIENLLSAIKVLNDMHARPETAQLPDLDQEEVEKEQLKQWLLYGDRLGIIITDIASHYEKQGTKKDFDYTELKDVLDGVNILITTSPSSEKQKRYNETKAVLSRLDQKEWEELLEFWEARKEKAKVPYIPNIQLVADYVHKLTAHEDYQGEVGIAKVEGDSVLAMVDVPPPVDGLLFEFTRPVGSNKVQLTDVALVLCGTYFTLGSGDDAKAKAVVSAMVDLAIAGEAAAAPEPKPKYEQRRKEKKRPKAVEEGTKLTDEQKKKIRNYVVEGPAIWTLDKGNFRVNYEGKIVGRFDDEAEAKNALRGILAAHEDEAYYYAINPRGSRTIVFDRNGNQVYEFDYPR